MIELEQERVPEKLVANNINRKNNQSYNLMSAFHIKMNLKRLEFHPSSWNLIYIENDFLTNILLTADKLFY